MILPIKLPDILDILERPHFIILDAEDFWTNLSVSLSYNSKDEGRNTAIGIKWKHFTVSSEYFKKIIPKLSGNELDWTLITFKATDEQVVIFHYVTSECEYNNGYRSDIGLHVGVISDSSLPIAKMRLIGDQIIQKIIL